MPFGMHGVFAALPAGVVFALQGFEQAVQLAGEARNPKRDLSRAIIVRDADRRGALLAAPGRPHRRRRPRGRRARLAHAARHRPVGLRRLVHARARRRRRLAREVLLIDAVISPAGTGVVYVGTTARLSYALGEEREMPGALAKTNKTGVPVVSILVGGASSACCASARSRAGTGWSASSPARPRSCTRFAPIVARGAAPQSTPTGRAVPDADAEGPAAGRVRARRT